MDGIIAAKQNQDSTFTLQATGNGFILWKRFAKPDHYGNVGARDWGQPIKAGDVETVIKKYGLVRS